MRYARNALIVLLASILCASIAAAQSFKGPPTGSGPGGTPGGVPGGLPGVRPMSPSLPAPSRGPALDMPSPSLPAPVPLPNIKPPAVIVPPPPAAPRAQSPDTGGTTECDCYRTEQVPIVDSHGRAIGKQARRVKSGKSVACCHR